MAILSLQVFIFRVIKNEGYQLDLFSCMYWGGGAKLDIKIFSRLVVLQPKTVGNIANEDFCTPSPLLEFFVKARGKNSDGIHKPSKVWGNQNFKKLMILL